MHHEQATGTDREGGRSRLGKGWLLVIRTRSSHHFMRHPDGRTTVVPIHAGETIGPGLMGKILRDCELIREEFALLL
ncbi:MAG: type II toxin-antitoxin system HicA family toxin [Isosphaeraceae bacterium]